MTTFDSIALLLATLIVIMLLFFGVVWKLLDDIKEWQKSQCRKLDLINTQIAGIWRGQDKIETNTAISASIVGKMYNNLCGIPDKERPQCTTDIEQKIMQMSSNNTATMLENMANIRKKQEHQQCRQERRSDYDSNNDFSVTQVD